MKADNESIHRKFNNWAWGYSIYAIDSNLCAYFWGTLLAIIASPLILLGKTLGYIIDHIDININWPTLPTMSRETEHRILVVMGHTVLAGCTIGYLLLVIYLGFDVLFWTGAVIGAVVGCILVGILLGMAADKYRESHPKKDKNPNLAWEWIKAKKNKNCPLLEWE